MGNHTTAVWIPTRHRRPAFVDPLFAPPTPPKGPGFALTPLGVEHNERDLDAWRHADDFAHRRGFTYAVLADPGGDVVGCVYIYPSPLHDADAAVRSWVRADRAELDTPLHATVTAWLDAAWPFQRYDYAPRAG
jgi:hypothetical protein